MEERKKTFEMLDFSIREDEEDLAIRNKKASNFWRLLVMLYDLLNFSSIVKTDSQSVFLKELFKALFLSKQQ